MKLEKLENIHWPVLHKLMLKQNFPDVPATFSKACDGFADSDMFGTFRDGKLHMAIVIGQRTKTSAFLDVICAPGAHGKWATKGTLKKMYHLLFKKMKLEFVWVQPSHKIALIACLKAGFLPVEGTLEQGGVLILTQKAAFEFINKKYTQKEK